MRAFNIYIKIIKIDIILFNVKIQMIKYSLNT